eukprot:4243418-Pleurochrysis_carterae.AAC.1
MLPRSLIPSFPRPALLLFPPLFTRERSSSCASKRSSSCDSHTALSSALGEYAQIKQKELES